MFLIVSKQASSAHVEIIYIYASYPTPLLGDQKPRLTVWRHAARISLDVEPGAVMGQGYEVIRATRRRADYGSAKSNPEIPATKEALAAQ